MQRPSTIAETIKRARQRAGLSQAALAGLLGVTRSAVSNWETETANPDPQQIRTLSSALSIPIEDLVPAKPDEPPPPAPRSRPPAIAAVALPALLPVYGAVEAGDGAWLFDESAPVDATPRPAQLAHARDAFALLVTGDSMSPVYETGDLVYVHPGRPLKPGRDVVIEYEAGGHLRATLKRLVARSEAAVRVRAFGPEPREFDIPAKSVRRISVVVGRLIDHPIG